MSKYSFCISTIIKLLLISRLITLPLAAAEVDISFARNIGTGYATPEEPRRLESELLEAAKTNDTAKAHMLLQDNVNSNTRDPFGWTPLFWSIVRKNHALAKLLIEFKANVHAQDCRNQTPLFYAISGNNTAGSELLLQHGAHANTKNSISATPLHWAAVYGNQDIAELLIRHGADINAKTSEGETPFHWAERNNQDAIKIWLLEHGADDSPVYVPGFLDTFVKWLDGIL
jgi:ankyrin repeat protein